MDRLAIPLVLTLALLPAAAFAQSSDGAVVYGLTPRRALSLVGVGSAAVGIVIATMARRRKRLGVGHLGRRGSFVALGLGLGGVGLGAFVVATAPGGLGTGGGLAGGVVGVALGCVAIALSGSGLRGARETPEEVERSGGDQHGRGKQ